MGADTPDPIDSTKRSKLTNPFVLALIPAITAILIAVLTIVTKSDSSSSSAHSSSSAPPATQAESDLGIRVDRDVNAYSGGWNAAFDGTLPKSTGLPTASDYEAALAWASTRGSVDVGLSHLRLSLVNRGAQSLTVRAIRAQVLNRASPLDKTLLNAPSAGARSLVSLLFNLDAGDVVEAQTASPDPFPTSQGPYFATHDVSLDPGETIELKLTVTTRTCYCQYNFEIEVVRNLAVEKFEVLDPFGRNFAITAFAKAYGASWVYGDLACEDNGIWGVKPGGGLAPDCSHPAP
jgi:hypothetical protein